MFLIAKGAGIDLKQLISRPNGFIEVDDIEKDIKELLLNDVTASAYKDEEVVKLDMDITSGVHNQDRGQSGERRETATVASLLSSASSERFMLQIMIMDEDPWTELGIQLAELNKQFIDDDTFIMVTGDDGSVTPKSISFDDIDIDYDVIPSGTATDVAVNKEVRQGQLIQLLNIAVQNPNINQPELLKQIFKEFNFKNFEDLIIEQPQIPKVPTPESEASTSETPQQPSSIAQEFDNLMGQSGTQEIPGLYPQMGGVGTMAQYLQDPNVQSIK
jgi:hypothetical protein